MGEKYYGIQKFHSIFLKLSYAQGKRCAAWPTGKHVHEMNTPFYPTFMIFYKRYRGLQGKFFLHIFDPKHRLCVLVGTASVRRGGGSKVYPQSMF